MTNGYDQWMRRTNLAVLNSSTAMAKHSFGYDPASRLQSVTENSGAAPLSATYSYLDKSPLVGQIFFTNNGAWRMTTTKQFDLLNRLTQISSAPSASSSVSFTYSYNDANQRISTVLSDGSRWVYQYDTLGQVVSGKRYWADGTPVAGQQFEYGFDDIGNRTQTKAGGDQSGAGLRSASYGANFLNQYTNLTVPGAADVMGAALVSATVTVTGTDGLNNAAPVYRKGEYFRKELLLNNTNGPLWELITVSATGQSSVSGNVFLPQTPEAFTYDGDGNLTGDGRWVYTWDGEGRLVGMETPAATVPEAAQRKIEFGYDYQGRRIGKSVNIWTNGDWMLVLSNRFLYDGWNLVAELNGTNDAVIRSYLWGSDLSGTMQGAGGVGGLLAVTYRCGAQTTNCFVAFDGNGNVSALVSAADGTSVAQFEYGPFGELFRATGPMVKTIPFRFSTKYQDDETDLLSYGYRYYSATTGRSISRDPMEDEGGKTLYALVRNDPLNSVDILGLYNYKWQGGMNEIRKELVQASINAVKERCNALIGQLNANIAALSKAHCPAYNDLNNHLNHLKQILQGMVNNIQDPKFDLKVKFDDMHGDPYAKYWHSSVPWYDDTLTLDNGWLTTDPDPDATMFHELSHGQGTDDTGSDDYNNAHSIEPLMHTDKENWIYFMRDKREADKKCKCHK